jgi:hypothetical protein
MILPVEGGGITMFTDAPAAPAPSSAGPADEGPTAPVESLPERTADANAVQAPLPMVSLVMGIAGVALGLTVIWFFAAIPVGIVALGIGIVARRRARYSDDPRALSRATIGTALGCVALLLGLSGAYFLPRVIDRWDTFFNTMQQDVNDDVKLVNGGLSRDVNRLDATLTRDLRRFEAQNRQDLAAFEKTTAETLAALETRLKNDMTAGAAAARRDLNELEAKLTKNVERIEDSLRSSDNALYGTIGKLDARIAEIERKLEG